MSQSLTTLSPTKLKNLKGGDKITIWYKKTDQTDTADRLMLCEDFPKNVAVTFSTVWRAEFPPLNKMKTGAIPKVGVKNSITVFGGNFNVWKAILNWMLDSCNGAGLVPFHIPELKPYTYLFLLRVSAAEIGCSYLAKDAQQKMERIEKVQIHSEDVRALWLLNPLDNGLRKFVADHVAIRFWEKRLKARGAYQTLRLEIPEFHTAINEFCENKKAERAAENKKVRNRLKKERAKENKKMWEQRKKKVEAKRGAGKKTNIGKQESMEKSEGDNEHKTVTMRMEVVREGTKDSAAVLQSHLNAPPS